MFVILNLCFRWRIQAIWETVIPIWTPKKHFSSFLFTVLFQQKICWSSSQWSHDVSTYFEIAWNTKMQTEEKNNETKRLKLKKKLSTKVFHSFNYVIDHASIIIFFYVNSLHCFMWFLLYYLLHLLGLDRYAVLTVL